MAKIKIQQLEPQSTVLTAISTQNMQKINGGFFLELLIPCHANVGENGMIGVTVDLTDIFDKLTLILIL